MTAQRFDALGRLVASRDPYLFDLAKTDPLAPFNLTQVTSLSGVALLTDSVDAGWRVLLAGDAEQVVELWDGRGSHSLTEYDELLRPVVIRESGPHLAEHTLERFTYAGVGPADIAHNLCGQLMRHDDPAGTVHVDDLNMAGEVLKHSRRFLLRTDPPDWPSPAADREALLETADGATTSYQFSPWGEPLEQTDASHNRQAFAYTVAGQLKSTRLTLAGEDRDQNEKLLVSNIHYNVIGQIESETAGNGVITRHHYDAANGRLIDLSAHKANGTPLHVLKYSYDAVGNVLSIEDAAQSIRYFNNQRIEPTRTYRYDTLYQLIEACGYEARSGHSGPALPDFYRLPIDPNHIAHYTQTYHYDAGGNLLDLVHLGAQAHGRTLTRERYSNRCLPERLNRPSTEEELANGFDANGNLLALQPGQRLDWDLRNQLSAVQLIVRKDALDDRECYVYDGGGQRVRKVNVSQTGTRTITREVRYLPGLEIRTQGTPGEILHVITVNAGTNSVQVLHWLAGRPDEVSQDQVRCSLNDHLKSSALELDQSADIISQEWYYPFGGTAYWAGRNAIEAKYKTVCYSGKERDASGLCYYGFRYYAPWLQRWINPDPAGNSDGLNRFLMVRNNTLSLVDPNGLTGEKATCSYFDEDLETRLSLIKDSEKRSEFIAKSMEHTVTRRFYINTTYKYDRFENIYQKEKWTFASNFRYSEEKDYFANDVTRYQYSIISKREGFFGHLPSVIEREGVMNKITTSKTILLKSGSEALLRTFLNETPNGKSTKRILDDFGLIATKVEINYNAHSKDPNYLIHVARDVQQARSITETVPILPNSSLGVTPRTIPTYIQWLCFPWRFQGHRSTNSKQENST
ncbi:RHS repeat domain-containing protein [Pseudomonas sp. Ant30-3]|uniref:RHS repeat domain-containing protein n=1 Tax=Pseudomonas sp. Ant30-3 TaxID=1488328 RepID=UPI00067C5196|nr:RHS repeat-associated core domain-containing protein [Pseudomonas sp. Ant30-3]